MNYEEIYKRLCSTPDTDGYTETHHIVPRCMGGSDEPGNLVELSARKHFIAHQLLAKIYPESGLIHAAHMMSNMGQYTSKKYEWLRKRHAEKMSAMLKGKPSPITHAKLKAWADPTRNEKISSKLKGKQRTETHNKNLSAALSGRKLSSDHKAKLVKHGTENGMFGKTHTSEASKKISDANKQKVICPHCQKEGGIAIMKRWHFDFCKQNPNGKTPPKYKRKPHSPEHIAKLVARIEERKRNGWKNPLKGTKQIASVTCQHCGKIGPPGQMSRWHGDNCKTLRGQTPKKIVKENYYDAQA